ncbi:MAG: 3-deoxy-7-phosphoheptulonate synthase [Candidatus Omnitrophica bacterium]|nr:3-deoxy-7-phosphoheptulonate synthase [Candidatus Omnitrophota bacterium]
MSFEYLQKIPRSEDILAAMPLGPELRAVKQARDERIRRVLQGQSRQFLLIIGPCSADNEDAVCAYVSRLAQLQDRVKELFILIPRIYTNKPRTTGEGYKGMAHQPDPNEDPNIVAGIQAIRRMHIRALAESGLTAADEMLYPENYPYLEDVLSYVAIGARSVENQQHRLTVSGLDIPVGLKNPTSGDLNVLLNSLQAALKPHRFIYNGWEVKTNGNPLAHCILRGAVNRHGQCQANYHYEDLTNLVGLHQKRGFPSPVILVDTNHANSDKQYKEQPRIAMEVMFSMKESAELRRTVRGLMIESYLEEGCQNVSGGILGKSITDPCLGWPDSEKLVLELADSYSRL